MSFHDHDLWTPRPPAMSLWVPHVDLEHDWTDTGEEAWTGRTGSAGSSLLVLLVPLLLGGITGPTRIWLLRRWSRGDVALRRQEWNRLPPVLAPQVYSRDHYRCRACGVTTNLTVDHRVALKYGGSNHPRNLQTLCRPCNLRKAASGSRLDLALARLRRRLHRRPERPSSGL